MSLTQWAAFVEVCRAGSIGAAAPTLGYSQSAVSRQIAALEADLQVSLLERLPRGVRPTPAGEALLHHARVVVNEAQRGREEARRARGPGTRLVVGAVPSAAATLVPVALRALENEGTLVQWSVVQALTGELVSMVRHGEVDVAVVTDAPPGLPTGSGLLLTHVADDEMVVVVPQDHPQASVPRIGIDALAGERWLEDNAGSEALLRALAARAGAEPRVDRAATDLLTKTGLVAAGHGIALVPGMLLPALRADLAVLRLEDPVRRGVYAVTATGADDRSGFVAALSGAAATTAVSPAGRRPRRGRPARRPPRPRPGPAEERRG